MTTTDDTPVFGDYLTDAADLQMTTELARKIEQYRAMDEAITRSALLYLAARTKRFFPTARYVEIDEPEELGVRAMSLAEVFDGDLNVVATDHDDAVSSEWAAYKTGDSTHLGAAIAAAFLETGGSWLCYSDPQSTDGTYARIDIDQVLTELS